MPISSFRLARLLVASGLLVLATFASAKAQETPLDPGTPDLPLPGQQATGFAPVTQLAAPENDYPNCAPAPAAWHPPIFYPEPELYCPTGVVHRDWWREKTLGFHVGRRQRMLEKDYQWRIQNGYQPTCCPPHSCWGHACECCPGEGCRKGLNCFSGFGEVPCAPCGEACGVNPGCTECTGSPTHADFTFEEDVDAAEILLTAALEDQNEWGEFLLISHEQPAANDGAGVETAGFCQVSDGCAQGKCYGNFSNGWGSGHHCPLRHGYGSQSWDECEADGPDCDCPLCRFKYRCKLPFAHLCHCLYADGPRDWRREMPFAGHYHLAYPLNPHHFDQRDGRIYAAQGYGHPVGVPLAPNVEHTYNYGWGIPSTRLTPVSRMPGSPGVANPAFPGEAGPGIFPPGYPYPMSGAR